MAFMGSSKISSKLRISIPKELADKMEVKDGDHILFYEEKNGNFVIKKG